MSAPFRTRPLAACLAACALAILVGGHRAIAFGPAVVPRDTGAPSGRPLAPRPGDPSSACPARPATCRPAPCVLRRGPPALRAGFGEAADRIREEARAKEEAAKAARKKKEAAKKMQEQVKKRMQARERAEAEKQKAAQVEAAQREAAALRRAAAAAKRREKDAAAAGLQGTELGADDSFSQASSDSSQSDEEEAPAAEKPPLSDAAVSLLELIAQRKVEGKTLKVLALMDDVASLLPAHDRAETAGAVVQALLQCGRAALALQAAQRAEQEGYPLSSKLLVSVAKAVSVERPRVVPATKPGRVRGQKARRVLVGDQTATDGQGVGESSNLDRCLKIVAMLEARGGKEVGAVARVHAAIISAQLKEGQLRAAKDRLSVLRHLSGSLSLGAYKSTLREFARLQSLQGVLDVLDLMRAFGVEPDAEVLELVANVAVHDVSFVKGAVSMDTLPEADIPEACFAGRSNVGKSSLVNMMCNRKKLAFTSKTPGKTQEFNYFLVSGGRAVGGPAEKNVFHLVDLPGVGYAEVPTFKREEWKQFYRDYLTQRPSLRVLFQLIDGRHGPLKDDMDLMSLVTQVKQERSTADPGRGVDGMFEHVIVLTKMDKRESKQGDHVVVQAVREALESAGCDPDKTPIVHTSSASKLGRDEMWRYLRLAAGMGAEQDVVHTSSGGSTRRGDGDGGDNAAKKKYSKPKFKGLGKLLKKIPSNT